MKRNLSTDNVCEILRAARVYELAVLEQYCADFMANHLDEVGLFFILYHFLSRCSVI